MHDPPLPPSHKLSQGCSKHGGRVCGNGTMAPKLDERPTPSKQRPHPRQPTPSSLSPQPSTSLLCPISTSRKPCLRRQLGDCLFLLGLAFQGSRLWFRGLGFREFVHELFGGVWRRFPKGPEVLEPRPVRGVWAFPNAFLVGAWIWGSEFGVLQDATCTTGGLQPLRQKPLLHVGLT